MNDHVLDLAVKAQVTHGSPPYRGVDAEMEAFAQYLLDQVIEVCNTRVKTFDVQGNEYVVQKYDTREKCVAAIREYFGIRG